jgi:putative flippase GtrA
MPMFTSLWAARRRVFHEAWRYGLVSLLAFAADYALLVGLTELAGLHYLVSAGISFSCGVAIAYVLSVTMVFRERRLSDRRAEFVGFFLIGLIGLAANQLLLALFVEQAGLSYALAKLPVAAMTVGLNFTARRLLLFTTHPGRAE